MKNIVIAAAIVATATIANAGPKWNGNTGNLPDQCSFIEIDDGSMTYDEGSQTWSVASPATAKVKTRNANSLSVSAGELVGNNETHNVTVNYNGSSVTKGNNSVSLTISDDTITADAQTTGTYTVTLEGSATMDDSETFFDANVDYYIEHTITCVQ